MLRDLLSGTTPSPDRIPSTVILPSRDAGGAGRRWRPLPKAEAPTEPGGETAVPYDVPVSSPWFDAIREDICRCIAIVRNGCGARGWATII